MRLAADTEALSKLDGRASVTAQLAGNIAAPRATGILEASSLRFSETGPAEVTARYAATLNRILIESLQATLGANTVTGHSTIDLKTDAIQGELRGDLADAALVAASVPAEWRPGGAARLMRTRGNADHPSTAVEVTSEDCSSTLPCSRFDDCFARRSYRHRRTIDLNQGTKPRGNRPYRSRRRFLPNVTRTT